MAPLSMAAFSAAIQSCSRRQSLEKARCSRRTAEVAEVLGVITPVVSLGRPGRAFKALTLICMRSR
jgi:hypothetical protein